MDCHRQQHKARSLERRSRGVLSFFL